jgi:hypothetical protein
VRLVDFLILLLETHAESLKRLAALFGEEGFFEILENSDPQVKTPMDATRLHEKVLPFAPLGSSPVSGTHSPYLELEGAVQELHLPEFLEFHLWAYPHYRAFIETTLDISAPLNRYFPNAINAVVDESVKQAQHWVQSLNIPPELSKQAEAAAGVPWIRFRAAVLKEMGIRPIEPVRKK